MAKWKQPASRQKYNSLRIESEGHSFPSKLEAAVFSLLRLEEKAGLILELKCQPNVLLTEARIRMIPDFCYRVAATGALEFAEAKGFSTDVWAVKLKLWRHYGPAPLRIFKGTWRRPIEVERVVPKPVD